MNTSSYHLYKGPKLTPTPLSDHQYAGLNVDLPKHASLTSHGGFLHPSAPPRDVYSLGDVPTAESPTAIRNAPESFIAGRDPRNTSFNKSGTKTPIQTGTNDSPFSSEANVHPSSGVPLNQSSSTMPTTTLPQHTNFSQLAEHQGIDDWNNNVFDDRWLLQPEEIWNLEARRESAVTVSPESLALSRNNLRSGDQTESLHAESQGTSIQNRYMQRTGHEREEKEKEHFGRHVATALIEPRRAGGREMLGASGMLVSQKGSHTNQ